MRTSLILENKFDVMLMMKVMTMKGMTMKAAMMTAQTTLGGNTSMDS